jgi:hypothetical protein
MGDFVRDPNHWLFKMSPEEWIQAAIGELTRAEALYKERNAKGGLASARRAAGMALNGALIVEPRDSWGRSFVDHLHGLEKETDAPSAVRDACRVLLETQPPGPTLISLRSAKSDERVLEAARDVVAHALARVKRSEPYSAGDA